MGLLGPIWRILWIWAYFRGFAPGLGHIWPIWRVLGLDLSLIWPLSGGPGLGSGPFWAYFKPKSAHLRDRGLDLGYFRGSWAWIRAILGGSLAYLSLNRAICGIWDWIKAISMGPGPGFGPFWPTWRIWAWILAISGVLGLDSGHFGGREGVLAYYKPKSADFWDLGVDSGHFGRSWAWTRAI